METPSKALNAKTLWQDRSGKEEEVISSKSLLGLRSLPKTFKVQGLTVFKYPMKGVLRVVLNELNILSDVLTGVWLYPFIATIQAHFSVWVL